MICQGRNGNHPWWFNWRASSGKKLTVTAMVNNAEVHMDTIDHGSSPPAGTARQGNLQARA